ncbi:MAG: endonuclease/exonuclease/phosphatase family protein [Rhodospirillales bacterium]|nr:endonuclease/exonuclease/phosphatase family protein [Rhodospirillales bacterium]
MKPVPASPPVPAPRRPWLLWAARGFLAAAVLGTLAPLANRLHPLVDLLGQFLVQVSVATVLGLGLAMILRDRWSGILLAACFAAQILQLQPHMAPYPPGAQASAHASTQGAPPGGGTLKIVHLNLWARNRDAAAVLAFLDREDPDIVALVEVTPAWRAALRPLRQRFPHRLECLERRCDTALFAKLPFAQGRAGFDQPGGFPMVEARFDLADGPLTIFGAHLARPFHGALGSQFQQARRLAARIATADGRKVLVGDLNAVPWGAVMDELRDRAGLVRLGGLEGTWPAMLPWPAQIAIDHALADPSLTPAPLRIGPEVGSDHLPVIVELRVGKPGA